MPARADLLDRVDDVEVPAVPRTRRGRHAALPEVLPVAPPVAPADTRSFVDLRVADPFPAPGRSRRTAKRAAGGPGPTRRARRGPVAAPSYSAPTYTEPNYTEPNYTEPNYTEPSYTEPSYGVTSQAPRATASQPTPSFPPLAMPRDPRRRRTVLGGASRWELLGVTAIVALVAVLTTRFWPSEEQGGRYVASEVSAFTDPSGAAAATPSAAAPATAVTPAAAGSWWSGAGGSSHAANGDWATWRGEQVTVGGTWDNGNQEMIEMHSICPGGIWARWNKPLDVAVGAIDGRRGETWAKAAQGAYDARWRRNLQRIKSCWGSRDPSLLYIRFAHEMNLTDMPWQVRGGEEGAFTKALTRYSALRYEILPAAKIVLCPSDGTSGGLGIDLHKLWPGKDAKGRQVVQVYSVDSYNSWVVIKNEAEFQAKLVAEQSGVPLGLEIHRMMAEQWGVPFAISEWAGNGNPKDEGSGADLPIYYQLMNQWFRMHAADPKNPQPGKLLYEIYFNDLERFTLLPTKYQPRSAQTYRELTWGS